MRPERTSSAMRSVTGTPTVRYATTLRTRCPASESMRVSTGFAISLRRVRMSRGSGSRAIICSAMPGGRVVALRHEVDAVADGEERRGGGLADGGDLGRRAG